MLTHFGAPQGAISPPGFPGIVSALSFRQDYFFSGHVAFPFLCFLLFKESRIRWFFLASSIVMGVVVLLGHLHYSIDVFAAFFITYASYRIGGLVFSLL